MDTKLCASRKCWKNCDSDTKMKGAVWAKFYNKFSTDEKVRYVNRFNETESSCSWQRAEVAGTFLYYVDNTPLHDDVSKAIFSNV
ncbi:hypothetical protein HZH68_016102 [Vespula germanica]|uniref:Uncharacterized protein n=1 Tax=Vespula germanica TaxID=30212 RepID=A0A834MQ71_VESGE|nr:hypothetical protein HZH68_016102 [Vespula germanica]